MRGRNGAYMGTAAELYENHLRDDFVLDDLEDDDVVTIYDVDTVLGYTVDIFKVGYPFLFLIALFLSLIFMFGMYF
ncbi:MAG: hypothetical protein ACM3UW_09110 [Bacillota bacterium]